MKFILREYIIVEAKIEAENREEAKFLNYNNYEKLDEWTEKIIIDTKRLKREDYNEKM